MDESLRQDSERKLRALTETPDLDLHVRVQEHRLEGYAWLNGRRYRLMGIRDEEEAAAPAHGGDRPGSALTDG
jgi:hypothetical protein